MREDNVFNILGGGINWVRVYPDGHEPPIMPLYVAASIAVPHDMIGQEHPLAVRLFHASGEPVAGVDPIVYGTGRADRQPDAGPDEEYPLRFAVGPFALPRLPVGVVFFQLEFAGRVLATIPLSLRSLAAS